MNLKTSHIVLTAACLLTLSGYPQVGRTQTSPPDSRTPDTSERTDTASTETNTDDTTSGTTGDSEAAPGASGDASAPDPPPRSTPSSSGPNCSEKATIPDQTNADQYTLMGVECFKAEKYALAYTYYRRAYEDAPSPLLTAAIGRSLHKLGIYHLAKNYYRRFLEADATRDRETAASADKIRQRLSQLQRDIETNGRKVRLTSVPADARVSIPLSNGDWISVGRTPATLVLAPGDYRFAFEHPDYRGRIRSLDLQPGTHPDRLDTTLFHREAAFEVTGATWKRRGFMTSLASIPLIATSGMLFGLSQNTYSNAENLSLNDPATVDKHNDMVLQANRTRGWGIATAALGVSTLGVGLTMFFHGKALSPASAYKLGRSPDHHSPDPPASATRAAQLLPIVSPRGAGLRVIW